MAGESPDRAQEHDSSEESARTRTTGTGGGVPVSRPDDRLRAAVAQWVSTADETEEPEVRAGETPAPGGETPARTGETPARTGETPAPGGETPARTGETPARTGETPVRADGSAVRAREPDVRAEKPAAGPEEPAGPAGPSWARDAEEDAGTEPEGTEAGEAPARDAATVPAQAEETPVPAPEESPAARTAEAPAERPDTPGEAEEAEEPDEPAASDETADSDETAEPVEPETPAERPGGPGPERDAEPDAEPEPRAEPKPDPAAEPTPAPTPAPAAEPAPAPAPLPASATRGLSLHKVDTPTTSLSVFGVVRPAADHATTALKLPVAEAPSSKLSDAPGKAEERPRSAGASASPAPAGPLPEEEPPAERASTFVPLRPLDDARPAALRPKDPRTTGTRTGADGAEDGADADKGARKTPGGTPDTGSGATPGPSAPGGPREAAPEKAPGKGGKPPKPDARATKPADPAAGAPATSSPWTSARTTTRTTTFGAGYTASQPDNAATGSTPTSSSPATPASITAEIPAGTAVGAEETRQQPLPPKAPLDLLAELTNRPPPPETPMRTVVRRFKIWTPLVLLVVLVLGVVQAVRPLPQPTLSLTAATTYRFSGKAAPMPWPKSGQAAMDVDGLGSFGSSGAQKPVPIASVAKVMTAYLVLRDHPVKKGTDGASITMDQKAEDDAGLSAQNESTVPVHAGQKLSQREAIEAIMLASANNIARQLARWDAGSEKEFVTKMNEAANDLGMRNTTYTDPSGLNKTTVSTAEDQVRLGKVAMKDPLFREVVRMPSYEDSNGTTQTNWNRLVPMNNTVGIKTGTTTAAGGNLLYAATKEVGGTTRTIVGAVLAQPPAPEDNSILTGALNAGKALIEAAQGTLVAEKVVKKGDVVGTVDDGLGGTTPVVAAKDLTAVGWPGLTVRLGLVDDGTAPPHEAAAGTKVGVLRAGDGTSSAVEVPVVLGSALSEPGLGTKLTRLG
nr:D-alanyl-D-alanine carboxypeptidase [Streptomyces sp. SPB074]